MSEALAAIPNAARRKHSALPEPESVGSAEAAFELYARYLSSDHPLAASLGEALSRREDWRDRVRAVEEAHHGDAPSVLGAEGAQALFGKSMLLSASRAETYHQCRYRFFCRYGLGIQPLRRAELDGMEYGTVAHYVLEHIFSRCGSVESIAADREDTAAQVAALIEQYLQEELGGPQGKTDGFLYRLRAMKGSLIALAVNLAAELSGSQFQPVAYELKLGRGCPVEPKPVRTPEGMTGHLVGSIDRVDKYQSGGSTYLRVIDYKTGKKVFSLSDVLDGLNMQMIIYLSELCAAKEQRTPAGLLYCPAFSGCTDGDRAISDEALSGERDKALRRGGMVIEPQEHMPDQRPAEEGDLPMSRAMEQDLQGKYIPVTLLKSGKTAGMLSQQGRRTVISDNQFELIGKYVRHRLETMLENVEAGQLPPDPIVPSGYDPCEKCDYYSVCRYSGEQRITEKMDTQQALEAMAAELSLLDNGGEQQ